jgi:hypothetical protein
MIATDHLVYVHLHKSGGTFVNECLMRFVPGARVLGYHLPRSLIPEDMRHLPVLGFVRSPWSYYVSWYAFQSRMPQPNALFRMASEDRTLDFAGTLRNLLELGRDGRKLDQLLGLLPNAYGQRGLNLPAFALAPIRGSGKGFYSYLFDYMYAGEGVPAMVGRVENLRGDLIEFLGGIDGTLTAPMREFIEQAEPRNASNHRPIRDYYDDDLAALVAERDRDVIERFDYQLAD